MMNKRQPIILAASILFLTIAACAIPGGQTASTPAPTVDSAQLDAIVAQTVSAVLQQTALAPTATQPATVTSAPDIQPQVTSTPLPQSSITNQPDGNALFLDEKAGFNLLVPPGWLPVRIDQLEYYDAFSLPQASDSNFQTALTNINGLDPNIYRLFVFDLQDGHMQSGYVNNINIVWKMDDSISLESDDAVKKLADALPASTPNLVVTSSAVTKTTSGIPLGIILSTITDKKDDGTELALFQKQVILNLKEGTLTLTFTTDQGIKDATLPFFDNLIESLKLGGL